MASQVTLHACSAVYLQVVSNRQANAQAPLLLASPKPRISFGRQALLLPMSSPAQRGQLQVMAGRFKGGPSGYKDERAPKEREPKVPMNEMIRAPIVRLIDANKEMVGVMDREQALREAEDRNLDLVMISPDADPPVCRMMNYSKYKYEQDKKKREEKKKAMAARFDVKELKMRYNIDEHDYQVRLRSAIKFLQDGDKVKLSLQFRGREMDFKHLAEELFTRFKNDVGEEGIVESGINVEGRQMIMMLAPGKPKKVQA